MYFPVKHSCLYNKVHHDILLCKLYTYGIRGTPFKWFKSYLCHRTQFVKIDEIESSVETTNSETNSSDTETDASTSCHHCQMLKCSLRSVTAYKSLELSNISHATHSVRFLSRAIDKKKIYRSGHNCNNGAINGQRSGPHLRKWL